MRSLNYETNVHKWLVTQCNSHLSRHVVYNYYNNTMQHKQLNFESKSGAWKLITKSEEQFK